MKQILVIQRIFPEYRKAIFDELHDKIDMVLLHSTNESGIKQITSSYAVPVRKWKYWKGDTNLFLNVFGYIRKNRPRVIIHELAIGILSLPFVLAAKRIFGYKFILWGHAYNRKIGFNPRKNLSDKYRLWLHRKADAIITYSNGEKEELVKNSIDGNKIFPALNTLDTKRYLPLRDHFEKIGKENLKQRLGFKHEFNLIFIGRLHEDKWPHYAAEVLNVLFKKKSLSIALHFVGSGGMEKMLMEYTNEQGLQNNIFFHGAVYDDDKTGELLFASDMMIMPGYVGLSVNHAFCFDCPVTTFEASNNIPAHSPEIEYIIAGKTGFIIKGRKVDDMAEAIYNYLIDKELKKEFKVCIRDMIETICPIEKMTGGLIDAINYAYQN